MSEIKELKQCPFCGSCDLDYYGLSKVEPPAYLVFVKCNSCSSCSSPATGNTRERAEKAAAKYWNRRIDG